MFCSFRTFYQIKGMQRWCSRIGRIFVARGQINLLAQRLSGEARGVPHLCIFGKMECWKYIWMFLLCFVL